MRVLTVAVCRSVAPTQYGCNCFFFPNSSCLRKPGETHESIGFLEDAGGFGVAVTHFLHEKCLLVFFFSLLSGLKRGLSQSQHYTPVSTTLFFSWQPDTSLTRLSSFAKLVSCWTLHICVPFKLGLSQ